jgi:hypothetical protein
MTGWFINNSMWTCPAEKCQRTVHRWLRETDEAWAARLRDAQERHGRAHAGRAAR